MDDLLKELEQFTGTDNYYKVSFGLKATDGIIYLCKQAKCFWLMDIVASYQRKLKNIPFQLWNIRINPDKRSAVVTCKEDKDQPDIVNQKIKFTDFPLSEFEFYCIDGIVLLKSEY